MSIKITNDLWIISDTHFGHKNIIRFQNRPGNHEEIMLTEWEEAVGKRDQILHLGDLMYGRGLDSAYWVKTLAKLPGEKFLIRGNHDKKATSVYKRAGFTVIDPFVHCGYAFTHWPVSIERPAAHDDWHTNIHGHTHGNAHRDRDGTRIDRKTYINVSVEVMEYKPQRLGTIWNTPA